MQESFLMNLQLFHGTNRFILGVYKYYLWHALIILVFAYGQVR
jgi:hypothetical protein